MRAHNNFFGSISLVVILTFFTSMVVSCGGGGGNSGTQPNLINNRTEVSAVITPEGGTIESNDPSSELLHVQLIVPPGALNASTVISLKKVDNAVALPADTTNGGVVIELGPDGTVFNTDNLITITYDDADHDEIVDYTNISADNLSVIYWDSNAKAWVNLDSILNRDKANNTITFETNHFSKYTTSADCQYSNVSLFTIDGLDFDRTFSGILKGIDYPARTGYLRQGILETGIVKACDIYSFGGSDPDQAWEGDASQTADWINELIVMLKAKAKKASDEGKKFIVVTHSWGTQLGTIGLSASGVKPDLFITLSDPAGSNSVDANRHSNDWFKLLPPVTVKDAQEIVDAFIVSYGVGAWSPINVNTNKWINYWDVGDLISGPLSSNNPSYSIVNPTVINSTERSADTTPKVHAITSLNERFWKDYGVSEEQGKAFRDKVVAEIQKEIEGTNVTFEDSNLEACIRESVSKPSGTLSYNDVKGLTALTCDHRDIQSIKGIQHLTNLKVLILQYNRISNIKPLQYLTNLQVLSLVNNQISDISPLKYLTKLSLLELGYNQISDINPISNLTNLQSVLNLRGNRISDIGALKNLTKLGELLLDQNNINNISHLEGLTNLQILWIHYNKVRDISALSNLSKLQDVDLESNCITDFSPVAHVTNVYGINQQNPECTPLPATCPSGNGLYCGISENGQNTNYLYNCNNGNYSLVSMCSDGCQQNPPGVNDSCKSAPATCPSGNGLYCGLSEKGQNIYYLYKCKNGDYSLISKCSNGCQQNPPGTNDACR